MRLRIVWALSLLALAGCDQGAPPLDELPLRDALRADPAVIAAMPDDARQRLAARFETARASDDTSDPVEGDPATTTPDALIAEVDATRARRSGEALIIGAIGSGVARAVPTGAAPGATPPLPPLEIDTNPPAITALESRALDGNAAALLRALLATADAHHLHRVIGWPIGAVAVGDTVYVGAGWLATLAPATGADAGADAGAPSAAAPTSAAAASGGATPVTAANDANDSPDAGAIRATPTTADQSSPYPGYGDGDGGVTIYVPPTPQPQPPPSSSTGDSCGGAAAGCAACDATSDDESDSCDGNTDDGSDDSCNNTDDGSDNSCSNTGDDGDDTNCQVSRGSRRHGGTSHRMMISLFAPLAFLFTRRRR